ncbi:MAG: DUF983 domain-containing protein [Alphaproteobacteria bacterium]|jgi:uncharacterized protein (DUF983 family)|nr:DUF983 domain-containing protein [Alphaproteobacteria bacterium]MBO6627923.1 DUF983 domain-containing protein [Alphaproteobacteria bacterium]MDF1625493.1 DUF983 domain-containing protein [Parvibaculaceae bacterium]
MEERFYRQQSSWTVGLRRRCPRCGRGKLYKSFLSVADQCDQCALDFSEVDSGDGPAVFIIMIAGFIIVGLVLYTEVAYQPPYWVHAALWLPLAVLLPLLLLPPFKAWLIAQQFKHKAREGRQDT